MSEFVMSEETEEEEITKKEKKILSLLLFSCIVLFPVLGNIVDSYTLGHFFLSVAISHLFYLIIIIFLPKFLYRVIASIIAMLVAVVFLSLLYLGGYGNVLLEIKEGEQVKIINNLHILNPWSYNYIRMKGREKIKEKIIIGEIIWEVEAIRVIHFDNNKVVKMIKKYGKNIAVWSEDIKEEVIEIASSEISKIEELKDFSVVPSVAPEDKKVLNSLYYEIEEIEFKFLGVKIE